MSAEKRLGLAGLCEVDTKNTCKIFLEFLERLQAANFTDDIDEFAENIDFILRRYWKKTECTLMNVYFNV